MQIYVSAKAKRNGDGSKETPFQTITQAANIAMVGDEVIVAPGLYREWVNPINGGANNTQRITYRSEKPLEAVISGAESVKNWTRHEKDVWVARIPNGLFGEFNPYTALIKGDWYFPMKPLHTGEVYLNGKAMYETDELASVLDPEIDKSSWDPDFTVYKWCTVQDGNDTVIYANFHEIDPNRDNVEINVRKYCFHPDKTGVNYITFSGFTVKQAATQWAPPTAYQEGMIGPHWSKGWVIEDCEVSDSRCSGISLGKYLQPGNENKWTVKHFKDGTQTERDAICQAQHEGWTKENIGSHTVRRCNIHDCGQTGIVGHLGGVFSVIEDNHIHHINNKQDLFGAEIGGIKMHAAIDVIFRRNHIHHCSRGMWLDWQAQGTRVTQNLFHDNVPPKGTVLSSAFSIGEDIFVEVSHGPTLIDNNLLLSPCASRLCTQGVAFVHNLIAGSFTAVGEGTDNGGVNFPSLRYTPYHVPHRTEIAGFMTFLHGDMRFYNNVFIQAPMRNDFDALRDSPYSAMIPFPNFTCGTKPYDGYPTDSKYFEQFMPKEEEIFSFSNDKYYDHLPVHTGGNVYFNGAQPCDTEENYVMDIENSIELELVEKNGEYVFKTNLFDYLPVFSTPFISTELLGEAFEPEQKFENPDGSPILFDQDYFGAHRAINPTAGPFESPLASDHVLAEW
jgi:hypothetical protein